jgi:signal transduction histidine kinase
MTKRRLSLSSLPIRTRLTLTFAVAMAVVLAAISAFVYTGMRGALDETIATTLRTRADDVAALAAQTDSGLREGSSPPLAESGQDVAQVLTVSGSVLDYTPAVGSKPLLTTQELLRASRESLTIDRTAVQGIEGPARLLAAPANAQDQHLIIVVGTSLEVRQETLSRLMQQLATGMPIALIAAALLAYGITTAAFHPVRSMREEAEAISGSEIGRRLPLPRSRDEIASLGATLNAMLSRLETALTTERMFVANASHELRTPLALLKTELELSLSGNRDAQELTAAIRSAAEETDRLVQLSEDLLVLARARQGRLPLRLEEIRARDILDSVCRSFGTRARGAGAEIRVDDTARDVLLRGDRLRLEQALSNLVDNALRYGSSPIILAAHERAQHVEIHVLDHGPGFDEAFIPLAFDTFARSETRRTSEGSGLGLSIVRIVAEAHSGTSHIRNREGGGADVWLSLPRQFLAARVNNH